MIIKPLLKHLCDAWPETRITLRREMSVSTQELIPLAQDDLDTDFIFSLTGATQCQPNRPHPTSMLSARSTNGAAVRPNQRDKRFLNAAVPATKSSLLP